MKTYQDWLAVAERSEQERMEFIRTAIADHKNDRCYKNACRGEDYYYGRNTTIKQYEKYLFNAKGQAIPDYVSANHKIASRFFFREVTQTNSVLLGNGITWADGVGGKALGADFDRKIIEAGRAARCEGVAFGFYNLDHVEIYELREFCPLYDEEDGALKAGIRFWQVADDKPLRATMFELDGYTEYMWINGEGRVKQEKRGYIIEKKGNEVGDVIYGFKNYPTFPVVPLFSNDNHTSELLPIRATIDAIDLIGSGYANDIDDASLIYWTITASGMDDFDVVQFLDKMRKMHAAQLDDESQVQAHTVDVPYEGRESILDRLEKQLYKDSMALNTYELASGAVTATQIQAAYEPLNEKLDLYEAQITDFIQRLLAVAGVEDQPTYTRSIVVNKSEEIQAVLSGAMYLSEEYVTEKIMTILGDKDSYEDVQKEVDEENLTRLTTGQTE